MDVEASLGLSIAGRERSPWHPEQVTTPRSTRTATVDEPDERWCATKPT
jgi:hypothetical protein